MNKTLDLIRNAKDGSYVDFRTVDGQIDSVPIGDLRALLPTEPTSRAWMTREPLPLDCQCSPDGLCEDHHERDADWWMTNHIGNSNFDIIAASHPGPIK